MSTAVRDDLTSQEETILAYAYYAAGEQCGYW
jgi:hypothetical protein